ncbi:hypothetical protein [Streptomyces rubiginosohelvolus]|uniref:hypothetical protein n=1 Tax=Streptomyces rubiginosohelvolus TaxID=67362 RepID=UPI0033E408E1
MRAAPPALTGGTSARRATAATADGDNVTVPAWRTKPVWYQVSTQDRMIHPDNERRTAQRMNPRRVIELDVGCGARGRHRSGGRERERGGGAVPDESGGVGVGWAAMRAWARTVREASRTSRLLQPHDRGTHRTGR